MATYGYQDNPLGRHGWVFQERLLSPRVVHFGQDQVFYGCSESRHCEPFPTGIPDFSLKLSPTFDLLDKRLFNSLSNIMRIYAILVQQYRSYQLTYPDIDKLLSVTPQIWMMNT